MDNKIIAKRLNKIAKQLLSIDFPNQKAMNDYLKQHPLAERRNHKVVEFKPKKQEEIQTEKYKDSDELKDIIKNSKNDEVKFRDYYKITNPNGVIYFGQKASNGNPGFSKKFESETQFQNYFTNEYELNSGMDLKYFK